MGQICNKTLCNKIQVLQNRLAKIIIGISRCMAPVPKLLKTCNGLDEKLQVNKQLLCINLSTQAPSYLCNIDLSNKTCTYHTKTEH